MGKEHEAIGQYNPIIQLQIALRDYTSVLKTISEVFEESSSSDSVLPPYLRHYKGLALYNLDKYEEAIAELEMISEFSNAAELQGLALASMGRHDKAITKMKTYAKRLATQPNTEQALIGIYYNMAISLLNLSRYNEVISVMNNILNLDASAAFALNLKAEAYEKQGRYKLAQTFYDEAKTAFLEQRSRAAEDKNVHFFMLGASQFYFVHNDFSIARRFLEEGLRLEEDDIYPGYLVDAAELYLSAIENVNTLSIEEASILYWRAHDYIQTAKKKLNEKVEVDKYETRLELGYLHLMEKEYGEARTLFLSTKENMDSGYVYSLLGQTAVAEEDFAQAVNYFEAALQRNVGSLAQTFSLASSYAGAKNYEKAELYYKRVIDAAPEHLRALIGLAEVFTHMADAEEVEFYHNAEEAYTQAISIALKSREVQSLSDHQKSELYYARAYVRVKLFKNSRPYAGREHLTGARKDINVSISYNSENYKAKRAREQLGSGNARHISFWTGLGTVFLSVIFVVTIIMAQLGFWLNWPLHIEVAFYLPLLLGSSVLLIALLYLPQVIRLKVPGLELEKAEASTFEETKLIIARQPIRTERLGGLINPY